MKTILAICLTTSTLGLGSRISIAVTGSQTEDSIKSIRRQYSAINKRAGRYQKVKKELSGFSLEGGELVAHFDGPAIVKIVATHYGEMGRTVEEYYYSNGRLIFAFEKIFHYDKPGSGKVVRTAENRFYFNNDKLLRWVDDNAKPVPAGTEAYQLKQNEVLATSKKFLIAARSKNRTIEALNNYLRPRSLEI